ncbi:hypothetical protein K439DRAFT_1620410 [Ramaria rubella]|nr:hypothetical protein K439DRAFT_1620410 [Ramaria rubella]
MPTGKPSQKHAPPLQAQLHALDTHCFIFQTRLIDTLDALDQLQRNHTQELDQLHTHTQALRARYRAAKARAKAAETERDQWREDVARLVEKVEIANDTRVLPHARIHLPYPLGSSSSPPTRPATNQRCEVPLASPPSCAEADAKTHIHNDHTTPASYFPSLLTALTADLSAQKHAFTQLQLASDARIATLEAQIARRDVELHNYQPCICNPRPAPSPAHVPIYQGLSKEQTRRVREETAMRQRALAIEVEGLMRKVEVEVGATAETEPRPDPAPDPDSDPPTLSPPRESDSTATVREPPKARHPSPPESPPQPPELPAPLALTHPPAALDSGSSAFQAERDDIAAVLRAAGPDRGDDKESGDETRRDERPKSVLPIEEKCIRLQKSQRALRQELLLVKATASATEEELRKCVRRLEGELKILVGDVFVTRERCMYPNSLLKPNPDQSSTPHLTQAYPSPNTNPHPKNMSSYSNSDAHPNSFTSAPADSPLGEADMELEDVYEGGAGNMLNDTALDEPTNHTQLTVNSPPSPFHSPPIHSTPLAASTRLPPAHSPPLTPPLDPSLTHPPSTVSSSIPHQYLHSAPDVVSHTRAPSAPPSSGTVASRLAHLTSELALARADVAAKGRDIQEVRAQMEVLEVLMRGRREEGG